MLAKRSYYSYQLQCSQTRFFFVCFVLFFSFSNRVLELLWKPGLSQRLSRLCSAGAPRLQPTGSRIDSQTPVGSTAGT